LSDASANAGAGKQKQSEQTKCKRKCKNAWNENFLYQFLALGLSLQGLTFALV
jgi:hypothetical protein